MSPRLPRLVKKNSPEAQEITNPAPKIATSQQSPQSIVRSWIREREVSNPTQQARARWAMMFRG